MSNLVNSMGLILDIIGALLIFRYGLPRAINREGHSSLVLEETDDAMVRKAARFDMLGRAGLVLLVLGFVGQLFSSWID